MRIESIRVRGFGCLVDRFYEFPEGRAALVIEENERGKSTLAAAILAGLCGFPARRLASEKIKSGEVYRPWGSESYGVEMTVNAAGRRLVIERDFGRGRFIVRDARTNRDISAEFEQDLAHHFLGLPREDFQRVAFVSGKDVQRFGSSANICERLSAMAAGGESGAAQAIDALENARYSLNGSSLKIDNAIKRLSDAIDTNRARMRVLDSALDAAGDEARALDEAQAEYRELVERMNELDDEYRAARLAEVRGRIASAEEMAAEVDALENELAELSARKESAPRLEQRIPGWVLAGGAGFCCAALGVLAVLRPAAALAGALVGVAIAAAVFLWRRDQSLRAKRIHSEAFGQAEEKIRAARDRALTRLSCVDIERLRSEEADLAARLFEGGRGSRRASCLEGDTARQEPRPPVIRPSSEVETEREAARKSQSELAERIGELERSVGACVDRYRREYPPLAQDMAAMEMELAKAARFEKAIAVAGRVMREVSEDAHRRWASALNGRASTILPHLNPDYDDLRFDDSLGFTIRRLPDSRIIEKDEIDVCLSTGAKDQIYLAACLACCGELSSNGESIPIILDDPLIASDDSRFRSGFRYMVEELTKHHQVIILTCHRTRHEAAISGGVKIVML